MRRGPNLLDGSSWNKLAGRPMKTSGRLRACWRFPAALISIGSSLDPSNVRTSMTTKSRLPRLILVPLLAPAGCGATKAATPPTATERSVIGAAIDIVPKAVEKVAPTTTAPPTTAPIEDTVASLAHPCHGEGVISGDLICTGGMWKQAPPMTTAAPAPITPPVPKYPSGDPVFPFFPRIVPFNTIDYGLQVAEGPSGRWSGGRSGPRRLRAVQPNVPDLASYLDGPSDGDCAMRNQFFPNTGGACWNGVQAGSAQR